MTKAYSPETNNKSRERTNPIRAARIGLAVVLAAAAAGAGVKSADALVAYGSVSHPDFSTATTEYIIQPNQGVLDAAARINGISRIDSGAAEEYIESMKANQAVLSHELQPGETLEIPVSVKP